MASPIIKVNVRGLGEVLSGEKMRAALHDAAEEIAERARTRAPVDTGAYRDSIGVVSDEWHGGQGTSMAIERVVVTDPKALIIESRTGNLKRALGG